MNDILVIIPAYNEEMNITFVAENLIRNYPDLDYVIVNDGSQDRTAEICRRHSYHMLDLPVNLGLAGAFQAGALLFSNERGFLGITERGAGILQCWQSEAQEEEKA